MTLNKKRILYIFFAVLALTALAQGLIDNVLPNYFKEVYNTDAFERGVIELPRETPGILALLIVSALSFLGDIRLSIISQALSVVGITAMGLFTPSFGVMLIFLFINSMGMHLSMPVSDALGLSLAEEGEYGSIMGKYNGVKTAFTMIAGILVFAGFKIGFFSFATPVKSVFLLAAGIFLASAILLIFMHHGSKNGPKPAKTRLVFRREYGMFYLISILFGARKQLMFVYGPWVLIELLNFSVDTMALLAIAGAAIGIFLMPLIGRWIDRFGPARIMAFEAGAFIIIYVAYALLTAGLSAGWLLAAGLPVATAFAISMADRMTMQFGMVRSVYMRSIAKTPEDVTPTLSAGQALDHMVSILGAFLCGFLWKEWGPQYVFILAAVIAAVNMAVVLRLKKAVAAANPN